MTKDQARELTLKLMEREGLIAAGWTLRFNNRKIHLGFCWYAAKTIELSGHFVEHNNEVQVEEIILHEIAHAIVGPEEPAHGIAWENECKRLGISPLTHYNCEMPKGKWVAICKKCDRKYNRHYRPTKGKKYDCHCAGRLKWSYDE